MTEPTSVEAEDGRYLPVPVTGELVDLSDPAATARALHEVRALDSQFGAVKRKLTEALDAHAGLFGSRTFERGGWKVSLPSDEETVYDAEEIEAGLREAGMPEERIREIVKEDVTYKVVAVEAKKAAAANPAYAAVIAAHSRKVPKSVSPKLTPPPAGPG